MKKSTGIIAVFIAALLTVALAIPALAAPAPPPPPIRSSPLKTITAI